MLKIVDLCKSHRNKDVNVLTFAWRFGAPVRIQIRYFAEVRLRLFVTESRLSREREEFKQKQKRERSISDREASERLKQAEDFIDNVKSPCGNDRPRMGPIDIG